MQLRIGRLGEHRSCRYFAAIGFHNDLVASAEVRIEIATKLGDVETFELDLRWYAEQVPLLQQPRDDVTGEEGQGQQSSDAD